MLITSLSKVLSWGNYDEKEFSKKISVLHLPVRFYVLKNINFAHAQIYLCVKPLKYRKKYKFLVL